MNLYEKSKNGSFSREDALSVLRYEGPIIELVYEAYKVKREFSGDSLSFCSIVNAKSGLCDSGCIFCAQAYPEKTKAPVYPLIAREEMLKAAERAKEDGASRFSIVTSGKRPNRRELEEIAKAVEVIKKELPLEVDVSLGILSDEDVDMLLDAGVSMFHHNLESSRRFYQRRVSKRINWDDKRDFVKRLKEKGIKVCSGGLFGMGEDDEDIVDLAFELKSLSVDSSSLNFLIPIPGTPLEGANFLTPSKALKILCMFRFVLPKTYIRICGGREYHLKDLLGLSAFVVDGMMVGGYLTRPGRAADLDVEMVRELGLRLEGSC